jgi:hypothetical protein
MRDQGTESFRRLWLLKQPRGSGRGGFSLERASPLSEAWRRMLCVAKASWLVWMLVSPSASAYERASVQVYQRSGSSRMLSFGPRGRGRSGVDALPLLHPPKFHCRTRLPHLAGHRAPAPNDWVSARDLTRMRRVGANGRSEAGALSAEKLCRSASWVAALGR